MIQSILKNQKYGTIYFQSGVYEIESPFIIKRSVRVMGNTPYTTRIYNTSENADNSKNAIFIVQGPEGGDVSISDFFLDSRGEASIRMVSCQNLRVESIIFQNGGIYVENSQLFYFSKFQIARGYGIKLNGSNGAILHRIHLNGCRSSSHRLAGFLLYKSNSFNFSDCEAWENKAAGFFFTHGCSFNIIQGCRAWCASQQDYGVYFDGGYSHKGNLISNFISSNHKVQNYGLGGVIDSRMRDCIDQGQVKISIRNDSL